MEGTKNRVSKRLSELQPSATLAVDARAKALKAAGENVIGFGAGEPDFPTPEAVVAFAVEACRDPKNHRYTPAGGLPELRQAIVEKTKRDSGLVITADQVMITNGGKHAIANAFAALLDPGDEVIIPAPFWTTYPESAALVGGVPVIVATDESTEFKATPDMLEAPRRSYWSFARHRIRRGRSTPPRKWMRWPPGLLNTVFG
jgi:aspartate aminotransferase